jgi:hypothetical protein
MSFRNYPTWSQLVGTTIEIRRHGRTIRIGTVEDAMPDSSALWLASDGVQPRTMYEAGQHYEAWVEPQEMTGTNSYRMTSSRLYPEDKSTPPISD